MSLLLNTNLDWAGAGELALQRGSHQEVQSVQGPAWSILERLHVQSTLTPDNSASIKKLW